MNICKEISSLKIKKKTSVVDKCYFVKYVVAGSNPVTSAKKNKNGSVAQMAEPVMSFIAYCLVLKNIGVVDKNYFEGTVLQVRILFR